MATRALTAGAVLGLLVAAYLLVRPAPGHAPSETPIGARSSEQDEHPAAAAAEPLPTTTKDETGRDTPAVSLEERSANLKRMLSDAVANHHRDQFIKGLVATGLSPSDSANIVQTLFDTLAECHFEAARRRYEAYGLTLEQFMSGAEEVWNNTPADYRSVSVDTIARLAPQCVALASQQAGMPIAVEANSGTTTPPEDFAILAEPNLMTEPRGAETASPDWASQMEANIRSHIERYPNVVLTDLRIKCEDRGCAVLMRGRDVQVFQFEFDHFAEENGFSSALPYGDESQRMVWLLK